MTSSLLLLMIKALIRVFILVVNQEFNMNPWDAWGYPWWYNRALGIFVSPFKQ